MIVLRDNDADTRAWKDPLVDIHIDEFSKCASRIAVIVEKTTAEDRERELARLAEHLCEMSRDLIYRINRITVKQVHQIIDEFSSAINSLDELQASEPEVREQIGQYVDHIRKRVDLLNMKLE